MSKPLDELDAEPRRRRIHSVRTALALTLVLASCSHPGKTPTMQHDVCHDAIEGLLSGKPERLRGLPATCTVSRAKDLIDPLRTQVESLGEPATSYALHEIKQADRAFAWLDNDRVAMVDVAEPSRPLADYLAVLGEPEAKLDYTHRDIVRPQSDLVWPSRGISIAASSEIKGVIRVAIFAPTTLDEYKRSLRYFDISRDEE